MPAVTSAGIGWDYSFRMANHFGRRRWGWVAAGVAVAVAGAGGLLASRLISSSAAAAGGKSQPAVAAKAPLASTSTTSAPPAPFTVSLESPAPSAKNVDGTAPLVISTGSATVDTAASVPSISPVVEGQWSSTPGRLVFTPTDAFAPATSYTVEVKAGLSSASGRVLDQGESWSWTTADGSTLRLQQILAQLGYLPLRWTPSSATATSLPNRDAYQPPAGQFAWTWANPPATLSAQWAPGGYTAMTKGAVMAFEADHGLATDGFAGHDVWSALLAASTATTPATNAHGYTYALAAKTSPETLTVWHDGAVISTTPANTGIPVAPTADGTFPVYERLATQVMKGTNPDGSHYADPVAWVAYFNGGDAIHYIARGQYGFPQSLGCVEIPYAVGAQIWPYLTMGSLVTVVG